MTQTSRLVLEIDSRDAEQKAADVRKALDALESAGLRVKPALDKAGAGIEGAGKSAGRAAESIDDLVDSSTKAATSTQKIGETASQAQARLVAMAKSSLEASDYVRSLSASTEKAGATFDVTGDKAKSLADLVKRLRAESDANVGVSSKQADAASQAGAATAGQADELDKLLNKLSPARKALNGYNQDLSTLTQGFKSGRLSADEYQIELGKVNASIRKIGGNGSAFDKLNLGTRQAQENVMQLANALQSGDIGSGTRAIAQLGAGAGASAAGLLSMLGPIALVVGGIAALGAAYYQGSKEQDAFRLAIVTTGNASGTTTGALAEMAKRVGDTVGTTGQAASALAQLAASGKIASSSFEQIAIAAISWEKTTGQAVSTTVAEFNKLAEDPVKAIAELNDKYNFLTASVYEQVRAAQEQGDKQAAAAIAEEAYAKALTERAGNIKQNLGTLERAWDDLAGAAKSGWDAILDIGRESNKGPDLTAIQQKINYLKSTLDTGYEDGNARQRIATLQAELEGYTKKAKAEQDAAAAAAHAAQVQRDGQVAYEGYQKGIEQNFTKRQKMNKALEDDEKRINAARAAGYIISEQQAAASQKAIRENPIYKESAPQKQKAYTEDAGMKALDAVRQTQAVLLQQNASINAQGIATEKVGTQAQALIKWEQQLSDIKGKKTLTADQKSLLASQDLITAQLKKNVALEREAQISRDIQQAQKDQVQLLTLTGQLRAANSLKSSLDDAAQMAEYERQGNTEAMKRLEVLIKIRDINLQASQKRGTVEGVSQAPQVTGIDASVGGAYSEIQRLNEESAKVDAWRTMELQKQQAYLDLKAINEQTYADRVNNINQQGRDNQAKIERAKNTAILTSSADFFGNMSALSQSGNKKLAAVGKAAAIAQATIQGFVAVQNALAVQPYPLGMALAVSAGVVAAANVASIAGVGYSGGGYTGPGGVYEEAGTVHKGEIVWSQKDIQRYGGVAAVESLRNGNVSAMPARAMGSATGGSMQAISSAPPQIKIYVSGDGSGGSVSSTEGYEQMGQAVLATVRAEMPKIARSVIQQEKGQNGLLDPSNRRNVA